MSERGADGASALAQTALRLIDVSERLAAPTFGRVAFTPALDRTRALLPDDLISLHGHPSLDALDDDARWRLGLLETVNFFSLNIYGEQALVAGLAQRAYRGDGVLSDPAVGRYLQHFIHEENAHTYMLAEFCRRYHDGVMPQVLAGVDRTTLTPPAADLLFFGRVYVLETLLDHVNRAAMNDESLEPVARSVHRSHHLDETQHMAFDRAVLAELADRLGPGDERGRVAALLQGYADVVFSRLVNPRVYRLLGLADPLRLAREVAQEPARRQLRAQWWRLPGALFERLGLASPPPATAA